MHIITSIFLIAFILLAISFSLLNAAPTVIHYFLGQYTLPLSLLLLLVLAIGCLLGFLTQLNLLLQQRCQMHTLKKKMALLNQELDNLRALPVKDN